MGMSWKVISKLISADNRAELADDKIFKCFELLGRPKTNIN